jgi:hypothetical protein
VVDACVRHPGDDVGVRDDEVGCSDPAGAFDAEPTCRADDAEDARACQADAGTVEQRRIGRGNVRYRPEDRRERIDTRNRIEQSGRWQARIELPEDP